MSTVDQSETFCPALAGGRQRERLFDSIVSREQLRIAPGLLSAVRNP